MKEYNENEILRLESLLIDNSDELFLQKFHQKSKWNYINKLASTDIRLMYYADNAPDVKINPKNYINDFKLDSHNFSSSGSKRNFIDKRYINFKEFSEIIVESFGYNKKNKKKYPSAGGLYSIFPLIYIYDNAMLSFNIEKGIYTFDENTNSIKLIKELDDKVIQEIKENISEEELKSPYMFAYCINIKRSIAKYGVRGYRHALIEVGSIVQNVRSVLQQNSRGELCCSGFNDDQLTYLSGLNVRNAPIVLLQWWG